MAHATAQSLTIDNGSATAVNVTSPINAIFTVVNSTSAIDGYITFITGGVNLQDRVNGSGTATMGLLYNGTEYDYTLTNSTWHVVTAVYNATAAFANVDGTQQTIAATGSGTGLGDVFIGESANVGFTMKMSEHLIWLGTAPTNTEIIAGCHNASLYWGGITGSGGC
jgi:hypothetical protein